MSNEILMKFIAGTCSDEELQSVQRWLDESDAHAEELFGLEQTAMLAGSLGKDSEARRHVSAEIRRKIAERQGEIQERKSKRSPWRAVLGWGAAAAAVAIIAMVCVAVFKEPDVRMLKVVALNESREFSLPDGSRVYLNAGSELEYPEKFASTRKVSLQGEGFFMVSRDTVHPFIVQGKYIDVEVLGTQFNVKSNLDGENNVSLVDGSVEVTIPGSHEAIVLAPGQRASYDVASGSIQVADTNAAVDAAWHDKIIPFENASIKEIAEILNQLYHIDIKVVDTAAEKRTYSGVTVFYSDIDSTLKQLSHTLPIEYSIKDGSVVITAR